MAGKTKAELEQEIKELKAIIDHEKSVPRGCHLENVTVDMGGSADVDKEVAEAVAWGMVAVSDGMKVLDKIRSKNTYGIYFDQKQDQS